MTVEVVNRQTKIALRPFLIRRVLKTVLKHTGVPHVRLSVVFVSDRVIQALNKKYLNHPWPTDVLSFDWGDPALPAPGRGKKPGTGTGPGRPPTPERIAGEIVISAERAAANSWRFSTSREEELLLYCIHGLLHLLGYDDRRRSGRLMMRARERELLALVCGDT